MAWEEAERVLRDRWGEGAYVEMVNITARSDAERWAAHGVTRLGGWVQFGPTPAEALLALASLVRGGRSTTL